MASCLLLAAGMIVAGAPQVSSPSVQQPDQGLTLAAPEASEADFAALLFLIVGPSQPANNSLPAGSGDNPDPSAAVPMSAADEAADLVGTDAGATESLDVVKPAQQLPFETPFVLPGSADATTEKPAAGSSLRGNAMPLDIPGFQLRADPVVSRPATLSHQADGFSVGSNGETASAQTAPTQVGDIQSSAGAPLSQPGEDNLSGTEQFQHDASPARTLHRNAASATPEQLSAGAQEIADGTAVELSTEAVANAPIVPQDASGDRAGASAAPAIHRHTVGGASQVGGTEPDPERVRAGENTSGFDFAGQSRAEKSLGTEAHEFGSGLNPGEHKHAEAVEMKREPSLRLSDTPVSMLNTTGQDSLPETHTVGAREWRPVIGRVASEIAAQLRISQNEAVIQLDPPDLGRIKIDLHVRGDKLQAHIIAEAQESHALIENHLHELRQALQAQNVDLVDVRVSHGGVTGGGDPTAGFRQQSNGGQETAWTPANSAAAATDSRETRRYDENQPGSGRVSVWA